MGMHEETFLTKTMRAMKELVDMLMSDNKSLDGKPWWFYAFVCPLALITLMAIAGMLS